MKDAYEFISTLPLVNIEQEPVNISIPWISVSEIEKTLASRRATVDLRTEEIKNAADSWSF
ncbi:MAG: hypothetical protein LBQ59_04765 [Candidatus Peribacteria bacterium]|nr:hypothetical protein [Candidatus Peribacteria bacterium]